MKKFPKIKRFGDDVNAGILEQGEIRVQEKLDGANFRFTWDQEEERILFGSRNVVWKNEKDIANAFEHAVEHVRNHIDVGRMRQMTENFFDDSLTFYGEAMHPHTIDYDWETTPSFIGFDVWDEDVGFWGYPEIIYGHLNLETAPVIYSGKASEFTAGNDYDIPESEYYDGVAEGIVIKNLDTDQRAKLRSEQFLEAHSGGSHQSDDNYNPADSVALARRFTTEARVKKQIHKMRDEGRDVEMPMMEDLWRRVFDDIIEEEYDEIFLGNYDINTKNFRSEVADITADVLQSYLARPQNSVLNQ